MRHTSRTCHKTGSCLPSIQLVPMRKDTEGRAIPSCPARTQQSHHVQHEPKIQLQNKTNYKKKLITKHNQLQNKYNYKTQPITNCTNSNQPNNKSIQHQLKFNQLNANSSQPQTINPIHSITHFQICQTSMPHLRPVQVRSPTSLPQVRVAKIESL